MKRNNALYPSWEETRKLIKWYSTIMPDLITKFRHLSLTEKMLLMNQIQENADRINFYLRAINAVDEEEKQEKRKIKLFGK